MTEEHTNKGPQRSYMNRIRHALHASADTTPTRLEFERRRLTASLRANLTDAIERRRTRAPLRTTAIVTAVAAAAAAAVIAFVLSSTSRTASSTADRHEAVASPFLVEISGLIHAGDPQGLRPNAVAEVPADAGAKIVWPDRTTLWAAGSSTLSISESKTVVDFHKGRILAQVAVRHQTTPFEIQTPLGRVVVHGTVFSITGNGSRVAVHLHEGAVTFRYAGGEATLRPGQALEMRPNAAPRIFPIDEIDIISDMMIPEKTATLSGPPIPRLEDPQTGAAPSKREEHLAATTSRKNVKQSIRRAKKQPDPKTPELDAGELFLDPELAEVRVTSAPSNPVQDPSFRIEMLLRTGDFEGCIRTADEFSKAHPNAESSDRVQFLKACCQTRSGDLKAGREGFETYLIRFPEGRYWKRVSNILGE